jgi:hypothetical protein
MLPLLYFVRLKNVKLKMKKSCRMKYNRKKTVNFKLIKI